MSQRFIRCPHCGLPHDVLQVVCPSTGRAIERRKHSESFPAVAPIPSSPPPRPTAAPSRPPPAAEIPTVPPGRAPSRDLINKKIGGKYVVRSVLGEGGMGTVFEAEHITIGRAVAVKVLHPQQARKKDAVRRFHQEARAAGAIGHPNICEVYDLGTLDDGSPYLVMEKLVGETLADRIGSEGGLPFDDVIDILTQVLSGLIVAHEKRIVHRDIKPENVFLTKRIGCPPVAKLLDFGVSKMMPVLGGDKEEDLDLTRTGMVMGTPYYMSPEQARGDRNLDARVDLYACGVIMYEALTGRRPFTAANYNALLLQILTTKPRPARELRPALPNGFDAVLDKSMARAREDRYQSAADFQRDLQTLRDRHNQVTSPPVPVAVADMARQAFAKPKPAPVHTPPAVSDTEPPPPIAMPPRPRIAQPPPAADPKPEPRGKEEPAPSSSSVEIPITFSNDTPLSGENMPVEATELSSRSGSTATTGRHVPQPLAAHADDGDIEEDDDEETQYYRKPVRRGSVEDDHTTQKRGPEFGAMLANAGAIEPEGGATEVMSPSMPMRPTPGRRAPVRGSSPPDEAVDTIVKPNSIFPKRRPARPRSQSPSNPDDTIKMGDELAERLQEARDRIVDAPDPRKPRAPKIPR